nr:PREDICTED: uncharacterized protein LOC109460527 [Rhinolophus sinicus]
MFDICGRMYISREIIITTTPELKQNLISLNRKFVSFSLPRFYFYFPLISPPLQVHPSSQISANVSLNLSLSASFFTFFLRDRNAAQALAGSGQGPGRQLHLRLSSASPRGASRPLAQGCISGSALGRGRGCRLDAHLAGTAVRAVSATTGKMRRPGLRARAMPGHSEEPRHVQACLRSRPAEDKGTRGATAPLLPPPTLLCTPPHLPGPISSTFSTPDTERELRIPFSELKPVH